MANFSITSFDLVLPVLSHIPVCVCIDVPVLVHWWDLVVITHLHLVTSRGTF